MASTPPRDDRTLLDRNDAIPTEKVPPSDSKSASNDVFGSTLREKLHQRSRSVQDRVFATILEQIIPHDGASYPPTPEKRSDKAVQRPNFSLPIMSNNFRRFNARIGVVFVFQDSVSRLFGWRNPTQTLSLLAVYTFVCLDPNLLAVLPLGACVFFLMVPTFLSRHPPPPQAPLTLYEIQGPASAPPPVIKPAPDMSKDFFRNMRDLQNSMGDFSLVHDQAVHAIAPLTNFSDERLSSTVFLILIGTSCLLFIAARLIPWQALALLGGWAAVGSMHPAVADFIATMDLEPFRRELKRVQRYFMEWVAKDIVLDQAPEVRQVEIFELQRQKRRNIWEHWLYSLSPYDPHAPLRLAGDRPRGSRFFEDVRAPRGWEWKDKKWTLDLFSRGWVEERMITAVEVETEGDRWVYDIGVGDEGDAEDTASSVMSEGRRKDWEESAGLGPKGQWRRRRWVRLVTKKVFVG